MKSIQLPDDVYHRAADYTRGGSHENVKVEPRIYYRQAMS